MKKKDDIGKPTNKEYAVDFSLQMLDGCVSVSKFIPVPGVPEVVELAVSIAKACDVRIQFT